MGELAHADVIERHRFGPLFLGRVERIAGLLPPAEFTRMSMRAPRSLLRPGALSAPSGMTSISMMTGVPPPPP